MIILEPIAVAHASALQPLLEDVAIAATTPFPSPFPPDGANAYVAETLALRDAGTKYAFAVCEQGGAPMGMSLLKDVDFAIGEAELGYWIGVPYWGRGVATAAAAATLDFAFDTLALRAVRAVCLEDNPASLRVLAKLGFAVSGRFPQSLPKWSEPRPSVLLRLSSEQWRFRYLTRNAALR
jgi:RimJ/RimL family protein N-acetyltransferase